MLDVVYNHLGPEGNYLPRFGPYFTDRHKTPWGQAVNYDSAGCEQVRRYVVENALYWIREYHLDGLRLDAVPTLTAVTAFQAVVSPGVVSGDQSGMVSPDIPLDLNYTVTLGALPAWFTPTGIACSAQIATADCTIANFKTGLSATGDGTAMTVTVVVTGQASPAAADVGSSGTASGQGCVVNTTEPLQDPIEPQQEQVSICSSATAGLAVAAPIATPAPSITPPPTATDASGTSGDAPVPWLAAALLALFCSLVLVSVRRVGQRR